MHEKNDFEGPGLTGRWVRVEPDRALAAGAPARLRPRWALVVAASLLALALILALSQASPADSDGSSRDAAGSARAASLTATLQATPELALVTPEKEEKGGGFGASVALSADGTTALVGAPRSGDRAGAAWVFTHGTGQTGPPEAGWEREGVELKAPQSALESGACSGESEEECRFGTSVALSADGDLAVVGSPHAYDNEGAVWIYERSVTGASSSWQMIEELRDPETGVPGRFGRSVAISADGDTVLVGAPMRHAQVWVFARSGSEWAPEASLSRGEEAGAEESEFGRSVALSADGDTALVGAPGVPGQHGGAWVFVRFDGGWEPGSKLEDQGQTPDARFGISVALSADGSTALVGARADDEGRGAAWVFAASGEGWSQQGQLTGAGEEGEEFGASVALSASGSVALIGAPHGESVTPGASGTTTSMFGGDALLFERSGVSWGASPQEQLQPGSTTGNHDVQFGSSVALSSDAETKLVGGRAYKHRGAAWVFGRYPSIEAVGPAEGPTTGGTTVTIEGENLSEARAVEFGGVEAASFTVTSRKSIVAVTPPASGSGPVDVTVETPIGISQKTSADRFTYIGKEESKENKEEDKKENKGKEEEKSKEPDTTSQSGSGGAAAKSGVLAFGPLSGGACGASLVGKRFYVHAHGRVLIKLRGIGAGSCSGKLTLRVKVVKAKLAGGKAGVKKTFKLRTIGTGSFAIAAGQTRTFTIKLNAVGRQFLTVDHGHLNTSLLIARSSPAPAQARTASIRLTRLPPTRSTTKRP